MVNSNRKGQRVELEAVAALAALGITARRSQQYQGFGSDGDLVIEGASLHTEIKGRKAIAIYDWVEQAKRDSRGRRPYWVLCKADRRDWLVVVPLAQWEAVTREVDTAKAVAERSADGHGTDGLGRGVSE